MATHENNNTAGSGTRLPLDIIRRIVVISASGCVPGSGEYTREPPQQTYHEESAVLNRDLLNLTLVKRSFRRDIGHVLADIVAILDDHLHRTRILLDGLELYSMGRNVQSCLWSPDAAAIDCRARYAADQKFLESVKKLKNSLLDLRPRTGWNDLPSELRELVMSKLRVFDKSDKLDDLKVGRTEIETGRSLCRSCNTRRSLQAENEHNRRRRIHLVGQHLLISRKYIHTLAHVSKGFALGLHSFLNRLLVVYSVARQWFAEPVRSEKGQRPLQKRQMRVFRCFSEHHFDLLSWSRLLRYVCSDADLNLMFQQLDRLVCEVQGLVKRIDRWSNFLPGD